MRQDLSTQIFTNPSSPLSSVEAQKLWLEFLQLKISPASSHSADALALALTHLASRRVRDFAGLSRRK